MAKSLTKDPAALSQMLMSSMSGGRGEDLAKMVMQGVGKKLSGDGENMMPDPSTVSDFMDKMMEDARLDPLNNVGQDFMDVVGNILKEKNLDPTQYGDVVKETLRNTEVKDLIQETIVKSMESGDIDQM